MHNVELFALLTATWQTIYIVFIASLASIILGGTLGFILFLTRPKQIFANQSIHQSLSFIVNATRSVPFIILMISILPLTRLIVGTTIGSNAAIIPLALAAIPYFARICENALNDIPNDLFETAHALGVTNWQLIQKILLPESLPALIKGITLTIISLIGYSAMAGVIGGGGLGELAINYGYQRFNALVTLETVLILIVIVQLVQHAGDALASKRQFKPLIVGSILLGIACLFSQLYPIFSQQEASIKVGVLTGWSEEVMHVAQNIAQSQYHLRIKIVPFSDYVLPNTALAQGDIDANIFQHQPYLDNQNKANHYKLIALTQTFVYPMGFYSHKIKSIADLKRNAVVALPNDPSNEARALLLLQKAHLIKLRANANTFAEVGDIIENDKQLKFKLIDAAQLPRTLNDADLVAITNDFLGNAHLSIKDALLKEGADSLYANIIAIRPEDRDKQALKTLVQIMHSKAIKDETAKIFPNGAAIPAW